MTNQTLQTLFQVIIAVGIILTAIGGVGSYYFGQRVQRDKEAAIEKKEKEIAASKAYSGVLVTKDELLFAPGKQIYPQLEFGDSGSILKFTGQQGSPLFKIAEDNDITIEVEGGQIKVSAKIRNKKGHLVAEILKNEWKVNPGKSWDRNYSKDALEVKDTTGDIILQVRLVKERVQFQAILYDATGKGIGFGKMKGPNGWGGAIELTGPNHPKLTLKIQPIFKYPSELHLGEFATDTKQGT
jgi:hypothetical protein